MTEVKCTVSNCMYWNSQNICTAEEIIVAAGPPESLSSSMSEASMQTPVPDDLETHCHTFSAA